MLNSFKTSAGNKLSALIFDAGHVRPGTFQKLQRRHNAHEVQCVLKGIFLMALIIFEMFLTSHSYAQSDSITVVNTKWKQKKIAPGIRLKSFSYSNSLFGSNQNINILEVKPGRKYTIDVEAERTKLKTTSEFGVESKAVAALNGTFFDMKNGGSMDYIRVNGSVINPNRLQANNIRALHQKAAILGGDETVDIVSWDSTVDWEERLPAEDVMVTGPLLLYDKNIATLDSSTVYMTRHPRSALAIKGKKILMITVDGRDDRAAGMTLHELAYFVKWLNADKAINLDGGGSTTLWIQHNDTASIVNHPSDRINANSQHASTNLTTSLQPRTSNSRLQIERPVANVIVVKRKK